MLRVRSRVREDAWRSRMPVVWYHRMNFQEELP